MVERTVRIGSTHGLHARPAKLFTQAVAASGSQVTVQKTGGQAVNAASILAVISQGIDPSRKRVLVLKSSVHYRGAFEPLASRVVEVDTPGLSNSDLSRYPYQHVRRPIVPLDAME